MRDSTRHSNCIRRVLHFRYLFFCVHWGTHFENAVENSVLSTIFDPQRKEVTAGLTELFSEVRHSPYVSLCPIIIKSVVMRWGRYGARPGGKIYHHQCVISVRNMILSRVRRIRNIILKYSLVKWDLRTLISLTFRGPCIVIYSYNKTNEVHLISQIYFWNRTLHVSDRFSVHHQESSTVNTATGICHTGYADCLLAVSWWNSSSILIPLASSQ
jgi:hypothetical protein